MRFEINTLKRKASLAARGFLVIIFFLIFSAAAILICVFYSIKNDQFINLTPSETAFYWHSSKNEKEEVKNFLFATSCYFFDLTDFLPLNETVQKAKEVSFALRQEKEAILFLNTDADENLKNKLEESNLNYILEGENITITNSKNALLELINVRSKKNPSLAGKLKIKLILNALSLKYLTQIYFNQSTLQLTSLNSIFAILPKESEILITSNYKNENNRNLWGKYNFLFSSILTPNTGKLEEYIKEQLALRLPILQTKILPDKTEVKEMIADPSLFQFQKRFIQNNEINYISEPKLNFEFAYSSNDNFFASNSNFLLENYLKNQKKKKNIIKRLLENIFLSNQFKYLGIKYVDKL